ncbi:serine protease inhibitor-like isoform X2 [Dysidea avara]|uniref:serine protease inhibitor-like isoform X2 n=1 Tax=Dysidea avara TaxID=196820 RepID=UPI00331C8350
MNQNAIVQFLLIASLVAVLATFRVAASNKAVTAATISNELGWKIFSCAAGSSDQHNLLYSPVSISTLLALMCYGAAGDTLREINDLLLPAAAFTSRHRCELGPYFMALLNVLDKYNTTNSTIEVANSAWHIEELHAMFKLRGNKYFNLEEISMDPSKPTELAVQINNWVEEKSHGKLTDFFDARDIEHNDGVYLFNVLYFVGVWAEKFSTEVFMNKFITCASCMNGSTSIDTESGVEYMELQTNAVPHCDMDSDMLQAIQLPYADDNIMMTIILPKLCAMNQVVDQLTNSDLLHRINKCLDGQRQRPIPPDVTIVLPIFKLSDELPVQPILGNLGLRSAFSSPKAFPKVLKNTQSLFLSKMTHKAVLEVDENEICKKAKAESQKHNTRTLLNAEKIPDQVT